MIRRILSALIAPIELAAQLEEREGDRLTLLAIREKLADYIRENRLGGQSLAVVIDHVLDDADRAVQAEGDITTGGAEEVIREAVAEAPEVLSPHMRHDNPNGPCCCGATHKNAVSWWTPGEAVNRATATPRDTLAQPEPGDLFVDRDGDFWLCGYDVFTARPDHVAGLAAEFSFRPATPEEAAKIRKGNGL